SRSGQSPRGPQIASTSHLERLTRRSFILTYGLKGRQQVVFGSGLRDRPSYPCIPAPPPKARRSHLPWTPFIIFCICLYCLRRRLISATEVPEPMEMRRLRLP